MQTAKFLSTVHALILLTTVLLAVPASHAASATVLAGQSVTLTTTCDGTAPFAYKWYKDGALLSGVTGADYTISNVQPAHAGVYHSVVSNSAGSATAESAVMMVAIATAPVITSQPASQGVVVGAGVTFTVVATGMPAPTFQWRRNGVPIAGATAATYTVASVTAADAGTYTVVATNSVGSVTSAGALLTINTLPVITTQPAGKTVTAGTGVSFTAAASGTPSPTYQWQKNGVNILGATGATYSLSTTTVADAGTYRVVATNVVGATTSSGAVLTVNVPITVNAPTNLTALAGNGVITLGWADKSSNEAGFEVQYSLDGINFLPAGTVGTNITAYADLGLPDATTFYYRVRAFLGTTFSGFSNTISATTPAAVVKWQRADIGGVGVAGSGSEGPTMITVSGSGGDIWSTADAFRYVYQPWSGDGVMITRVASLDNTHTWAKAGIMFRESLDANARNTFVYTTPSNGYNLQIRSGTGAVTTTPNKVAGGTPVWLKLQRAGNFFTASYSADGLVWKVLSAQTVTMATNLYVGLAVTSHNNAVSTIAVFEQTYLGTGAAPQAPDNLTATTSSGAVTLAWNDRSANEAGFEIQYSVNNSSFLTAGTVGPNVKTYTDAGLPDATKFTYRVRAFLGTTFSPFSNPVSATTPPPKVNWVRADIGGVGVAGSGSEGPTMITVSGSGADIWSTADSFRYVYQPWTGDGVMITRVASVDYTHAWAKAGVMFRETLGTNARNVFLFATPAKGVNLQTRASVGGTTVTNATATGSAPVWLKLARSGSVFTASYSTNGISWTVLSTQTVAMAANLYVGYAVTSHDNTVSTIAVFDTFPITVQ